MYVSLPLPSRANIADVLTSVHHKVFHDAVTSRLLVVAIQYMYAKFEMVITYMYMYYTLCIIIRSLKPSTCSIL